MSTAECVVCSGSSEGCVEPCGICARCCKAKRVVGVSLRGDTISLGDAGPIVEMRSDCVRRGEGDSGETGNWDTGSNGRKDCSGPNPAVASTKRRYSASSANAASPRPVALCILRRPAGG